ncbi:hypothetical protein H0H92_014714 [Tricholoma furcatifolium]|nr:hypothetical protein H0H92_014714 [Tricholoma furcatifolium]
MGSNRELPLYPSPTPPEIHLPARHASASNGPSGSRWCEAYPSPTATVLGKSQTMFKKLHEFQTLHGQTEWTPFLNKEEWELAKWLNKSVGQNAVDEYLKLPIVQESSSLSFYSKYSFMKKVDTLPTGPEWTCDIIEIPGNCTGDDGEMMKESLELWRRDPVECIQQLIGNPEFDGHIAYQPERVYADAEGRNAYLTRHGRRIGGGKHRRGELLDSVWRNFPETLQLLEKEKANQHKGYPIDEEYDTLGIRAVFNPFWKSLPHTDIFRSFTPDILHQLHKGIFKDHLVNWCTEVIGSNEMDIRFRAMNTYPGLRHFKSGISVVSQWTGTELKEMEKVFVGVMAGAVNDDVLTVTCALIDFIYLAQLTLHTSKTLSALRKCLETFHQHKTVFVRLGIRDHFNIPKLHNILHYLDQIVAFGSADGYNTELPERLHIDYAKSAYRATNRRDYTAQMTLWLQRQEAIALRSYLDWLHPTPSTTPVTEESLSSDTLDNTDKITPPPSSTAHYRVAKVAPFAMQTVQDLVTCHGAVDFLAAFISFVQKNIAHAPTPSKYNRFDVYKQLIITLPRNHHVSSDQLVTQHIRTTPTRAAHNRSPAIVSCFDTAFVIEDPANYSPSQCLKGLRVAQVCVIFDLPTQFGPLYCPLTYIEWFTPLSRPDQVTGMYLVHRSTRAHRPNAEIVSIDRIVRACHLIPKCGREIDRKWTKDNVLEKAAAFWINPYISVEMFVVSKLDLL